jgi:hypothetical protein
VEVLTTDFETYYAADYTLSQKTMTTESYVRDPRFKIHMAGMKLGDEPTQIFPELEKAPPAGPMKTMPVGMICHHAHFDGLILSQHYHTRPAFWFDTLSMGRLVFPHLKSHGLDALARTLGVGAKNMNYENFKGVHDLRTVPGLYEAVAEGCIMDVEMTYAIFKALLPYVPKEELQIIDITVRMFTEPCLALDKVRLQNYLTRVQAEKESLLQQLGVTKSDLQSAEKFATLLRELGVEPPTKESPSDPTKTIYAFAKTDDGMKALEEDDDERVQMLAAARLGQKSTLGETRAQRLLSMDTRGPLPVYLKYAGAHTTRWSGGDKVNWQNFTRGSDLRMSIMAPPGYRLCVGDLSQIECRMLNYIAGQTDILEAFAQGRDLYSEGATRFYGRLITRGDKLERHLGKTLELGCGYGMGWAKFQLTCRKGALGGPPIILEDTEAKRAVHSYRDSHPCVKNLWGYADNVLAGLLKPEFQMEWIPGILRVGMQRIWGPNGTYLDYTNLTWDDDACEFYVTTRKGRTKIYGAKLVENVIQYLARIVLSQAMLKLHRNYKLVLQCHDEVVYIVPESEADAALELILNTLKTPPVWCPGIPLDAEGGHDVIYSK